MVGVAMGLASRGAIPFPSTFACFLERASDFIRMAGISSLGDQVRRLARRRIDRRGRAVADGTRGPRDDARRAELHGVLSVGRGERVSAGCCSPPRRPGPVYLRLSRPKTPVIYRRERAISGWRIEDAPRERSRRRHGRRRRRDRLRGPRARMTRSPKTTSPSGSSTRIRCSRSIVRRSSRPAARPAAA